ncbi:hypothetical protein CFC21_000380 [Triticum aestivum]|uniref:Uncharacterized protein n=2 Tax=Triticum TaxID=4564 RepID=A0A9R0VU18_TRITD|nr:hypothetical protein CFC21_000380 [Triticum aestivum]VAH87245.1 unnamed protein product [Triticum turgidum subsp. durum]
MDNQQEGNSMRSHAPRKVLPPSSTQQTRERHKDYIAAVTKMKNATKTPTTSISFLFSFSFASNQHLISTRHHKGSSIQGWKYIFEYIKKGIPDVQFVHKEEDIVLFIL